MSFMLLGILNSQAAGGGGSPAFDLLETTILASDASSVTFSGLGAYSDYKHLQIRYVARGAGAGYNNALFAQLNDITNSQYVYHGLFANGSGTGNLSSNSSDAMLLTTIPYTDAAANTYSPGTIDILDFNSSQKNTTLRTFSGRAEAGEYNVSLAGGLLINASAVTKIKLYATGANLKTGTRFSIYGVK
jgi:hypothetical protein